MSDSKSYCWLTLFTAGVMIAGTSSVYFEWSYVKDIYIVLIIAALLCTRLFLLSLEKTLQKDFSPYLKLSATILLFWGIFKYLRPIFCEMGSDDLFLFQAVVTIIYGTDIRQYLQDLSK